MEPLNGGQQKKIKKAGGLVNQFLHLRQGPGDRDQAFPFARGSKGYIMDSVLILA
jgi:hypothetical protein